jgi:two-component system sensor histidine kinase TtrS
VALSDFRILNRRDAPGFPFLLSTSLFPEWPFSKVRHTPNELAQRVAVALLRMPADHPAARAGGYAGWTIPLDYQPVHRLLEALRQPPYDHVGRFTLADALERYWLGLLLGLLALLVMALLTAWALRLNTRLARAKARLEQQHELILNSVAEGIYGVDLEGRTTFVNQSMETMTGWRAADLIGRNQHRILHHTHPDGSPHPEEECPVYATFRDNRPRFVEDDVFWRKDGTGFPVEYSSTPIRDERRRTVGSVVVFRDVTERKQAAERIRHHQLELAHVARLSTLGEMASGIAHELNQPLTAIATNARACVRMLESGPTDREACSDVMEKIAAQAERAGQVIRHIRHFVRKEEPELKPARVSAMLETVADLLRPDAQRAGVVLDRQLDRSADWVLAREIQIEQVILNLARNAIEAMSEAPAERRRLLLRTRGRGERVEIEVADTGPGLSPDVSERIFAPFVTTKAQGLGLGLSISSGIVDSHGGKLAAENRPGEGATFRFSLLSAEEPAP